MNKRHSLPLLLFFLSVACVFAAREENVVLQTAAGNIYGTLSLPETQSQSPVVLIIAGSGPTDRNGNQAMMQNNSLKYLAEGLAENGVASLRFDKRGIGESKMINMREENLRFDHYIDDVRLWIDYLSRDARFSSITVAGHSEGSLIGMIASKNHPKVKSFISLAGSALPADEIIREQLKSQPQALQEMVAPILEQLMEGKTVPDVSPMLASLFRASVQPYLMSWMKYKPQTELGKLNIPILILQGTNDIQVGVHHADLLSEANPRAQKVIIDGMNHVLKPCESKDQAAQMIAYTNPGLPLSGAVIPAILRFINLPQ
jgi:pimeloyl-ACP methyl ester carboxylesterase